MATEPQVDARGKIEEWLASRVAPSGPFGLEVIDLAGRTVRAALAAYDEDHHKGPQEMECYYCECGNHWPCDILASHEAALWKAISGGG